MGITYDIPHTEAKLLLDVPEGVCKAAILFVPGISGGAFSERYAPLVSAAQAQGFAMVRMSSWEGEHAIDPMTPASIFADLHSAIQLLHELGFAKVVGVGKSFGGGMMLADVEADLSAKVLWAPAIGYAEGETFQSTLNTTFASFSDLLARTLSSGYLARYSHPVCFIHGTADTAVPFDNSVQLCGSVPGSILVPIEGADHSYRDPAHEALVIQHTLSFIEEHVG